MTPYEQHALLEHALTKYSPNGVDLIEQCTVCAAQWLWLSTLDYPLPLSPQHTPPIHATCQQPMRAAGYGAYPYNCVAKDKRPHALIYVCDACHVWQADKE